MLDLDTDRDCTGQLFVWRESLETSIFCPDGTFPAANSDRLNQIINKYLPPFYKDIRNSQCLFCRGKYSSYVKNPDIHTAAYGYQCEICGFAWNYSDESVYGDGVIDSHEAYERGEAREGDQFSLSARSLIKLDINDARLGIDELGTHLQRRFSDIYVLDWRIFEHLVADIYRNQGYHTRVTSQTRDGGYDVILLESSNNQQIIIEVKRYAASRKVGINTVDRLLGVQLRTGIPRAKIVTCSGFTSVAKNAASHIIGNSEYELELVDADKLLRALDVYNKELPPLWLDSRFRD